MLKLAFYPKKEANAANFLPVIYRYQVNFLAKERSKLEQDNDRAFINKQ